MEKARARAFHLAFWPGIFAGAAFAAGCKPQWAASGEGAYAILQGLNRLVTVIVFVGFGIGTMLDSLRNEGW